LSDRAGAANSAGWPVEGGEEAVARRIQFCAAKTNQLAADQGVVLEEQLAHPDDPVLVPAGSIACFSTTVFHRSGPNSTERMRRVYLAQYTAEPLLSEDRSRPRMIASLYSLTASRSAEEP